MHPPPFRHQARLSDWPDCFLHLYCCRYTTPSVRSFLDQLGNMRFAELIERLRCQQCRQAPAPVYLCASHHMEACGGPSPDWAVELVPKPDTPLPYKLLGLRKYLGRIVSEPVTGKGPAGVDGST